MPWYPLVDAQTEKARANRVGAWINRIPFFLFWPLALILSLSPSRMPFDWRVGFIAAIAVIPVILYALISRSRRGKPRRVPLRLGILSEGITVEYADGGQVTIRWDDPAASLTVFEAAHPNQTALRWLYLGKMSVYDGIRLDPSLHSIVTRSAEAAHFAKNTSSVRARWPDRMLTWTVYRPADGAWAGSGPAHA